MFRFFLEREKDRLKGPDVMGWLKNAFAIKKPGSVELTPRQEEIIERLACKVIEWKMSVPAVLFLESMKPLNYVGSQILVFFSPIVNTIFTVRDYDEFVALMEQRESVEVLLRRIESKEAAGETKAAAGEEKAAVGESKKPGA